MTSAPGSADPYAPLRQRSYLGLLVIAAVLGVPISAVAYFFLVLTASIQKWVFADIPNQFGSSTAATWWPVVPLAVGGLVVGLIIRHLPGGGGELPLKGFAPGGLPVPSHLPGIVLAALTSIGLGAVVGPEAPLIAIGGGLAYLAVKSAKKDIPNRAGAMIAASGSFAAVSALLGSPLLGAFLMMEIVGIGGATMELVLIPGLLSAGIGYLIFVGLDHLTGLGSVSLSIPSLPAAAAPTLSEFCWAVVIGLAAPLLVWCIRRVGFGTEPLLRRLGVGGYVVAGLAVALLAIGYGLWTGRGVSDVLFDGQSELPSLADNAAGYSVGALLGILLFKGIAYGISLAAFRGARPSPPCTSEPPAGSPCPTCPACRWCRGWPSASAR